MIKKMRRKNNLVRNKFKFRLALLWRLMDGQLIQARLNPWHIALILFYFSINPISQRVKLVVPIPLFSIFRLLITLISFQLWFLFLPIFAFCLKMNHAMKIFPFFHQILNYANLAIDSFFFLFIYKMSFFKNPFWFLYLIIS